MEKPGKCAPDGVVDFCTMNSGDLGVEDFLISTWKSMKVMAWSSDSVRIGEAGDFQLILQEHNGALEGGEVQSKAASTFGTWSWYAQAPELQSGAVFAMFTYRANHEKDPWIEFDYEFIKGTTTSVQIAVHMDNVDGEHVKSSHVVPLDFDASKGQHLYEMEVHETSTDFLIDGELVLTLRPDDMPDGFWRNGEMRTWTSLWAATEAPEWAGPWDYQGPMIGTIGGLGMPSAPLFEGEPGSQGHAGNDRLVAGPEGAELIGLGGNDFLHGGPGDNVLLGGEGRDILRAGTGTNRLDGGPGKDVLIAGSGTTTMTGGDGADTFVVPTLGDVAIADFSIDQKDVIDLTGLRIGDRSYLLLTQEKGGTQLLTLQVPGQPEQTVVGIENVTEQPLSLDLLASHGAFAF